MLSKTLRRKMASTALSYNAAVMGKKGSPPRSAVPAVAGDAAPRPAEPASAERANPEPAKTEPAKAESKVEVRLANEPLNGASPSSPHHMVIRTPGLPVTRSPRSTPQGQPSLASAVAAAVERVRANNAQPAAPTVQEMPKWSGDPIAPQKSSGGEHGGPKPAVVTIRAGNAWEPEDAAVAATDGVAQAPVRIGAYEVAARVARGGMGSLYLCRRAGASDGRLYIMKVIRQHTVQHELAAASFQHEALIGSLLRHPNALTVIDTGVHEGQPFLIYEYVEGGALADLLVEETRPTPAIVVSIVLDVLAALHAAHQTTDNTGKPLGLVHCDISPENVVVGVDGVARLADFGSARFTAIRNESQPFAVSKPPYMPPEQFRGDKLDSRSDIYSTGVLLYTALAGQQPFAAEGYEQTVINVMRKKVKPPSAHGAPRCLDDICMQAINRSPDGRFVVAGAAAAALRGAAEANNLIETREAVGRWVRTGMSDELGRRRRLVEAMFSVASGASAASAASGRRVAAPKGPTPGRGLVTISPPPSVQGAAAHERARTPAHGAATLAARSNPGRRARRRPGLTEQQQTIIAISCAVAFAATVTIGFGISSKPRPEPGRASRPAATAPQGALGGDRSHWAGVTK
jgi:serine/threonine-protein kinase